MKYSLSDLDRLIINMFHATIKLEIRGWIKHEKKHFEKKTINL